MVCCTHHGLLHPPWSAASTMVCCTHHGLPRQTDAIMTPRLNYSSLKDSLFVMEIEFWRRSESRSEKITCFVGKMINSQTTCPRPTFELVPFVFSPWSFLIARRGWSCRLFLRCRKPRMAFALPQSHCCLGSGSGVPCSTSCRFLPGIFFRQIIIIINYNGEGCSSIPKCLQNKLILFQMNSITKSAIHNFQDCWETDLSCCRMANRLTHDLT